MDAAYSQPPSAGEMGVVIIFPIVIAVVYVIAMWRVFTKAGQPGWACIIPIYNLYVLLQIIGRPGWWLLLYFIPGVNLVVSVINALDLAKAFGKSSMFGIFGLWLFGFIGYLMLGFGKDQYLGPNGMGTDSLSTVPPHAGEVTPMNKPPVTAQPVAEKPLIQDVTPMTPAATSSSDVTPVSPVPATTASGDTAPTEPTKPAA